MQLDCEIVAMTNPPASFPLDLSGHRDVPPEEIAPLLERAVDATDERAIPAVTALLMNRLVRLLRQGSRQEILDEALMLNRLLAVDAGKRLQERRPETYGGWAILGELLSGAARSTGRSAVPSLLRATQGRGMAILELLAGEGRALPRAEVRRRLGFPEAQLSHLLRDLEEADLIVRYRRQGSKEVFVELCPAGREVVRESILPPWLERLAKALSELAEGSAIDAESLANELHETGAPSRLAAETLARPLERLAPAGAAKPVPRTERSNVLPFVKELANAGKDDGYRLQEVIDLQGGQSPRNMFKTSATRR